MNNKGLKGIALILFGILLSVSSPEINSTILSSFSDVPFSLLGLLVGALGVAMVFGQNET